MEGTNIDWQNDHVTLLAGTTGTWTPVCLWFPPNGSRGHFGPINIGTFHILPTGIHGLCFGSYFSGLLPQRSLQHGPLSRVHFGESLVVRLYSEIDQIHLSSEAHCVSHHLPQVDCHTHDEALYTVSVFSLINLS